MTKAEQTLKLALTNTIEKWVEDNCEDPEWAEIDIIVPDTMCEDMADAAFGIFQAIAKSQRYCVDEGYVKPV